MPIVPGSLRLQRRRLLYSMAACALTGSLPAHAQAAYPKRPVRLIVPFPPGGPADVLGRAIAQRLSEKWGQAVIVDNRPGANTNIAAAEVARATADGYTLFMPLDSTFTMNPALYSKLPFDPFKDFAPISILATQSLVLTASESTHVNSVAELVALAKRRPGELNYGCSTTSTQLAGEMFKRQTATQLAQIPYKGASEVLNAILSGAVQVAFDGIAANVPYIRSGKIRALATTGPRRSEALPDVPTLAEAGLKGYEVEMWNGLAAPAGTPHDVLAKIAQDVAEVARRKDVGEHLRSLGFEMVGSTPAHMAESIRTGAAKYLPLITQIGLKIG